MMGIESLYTRAENPSLPHATPVDQQGKNATYRHEAVLTGNIWVAIKNSFIDLMFSRLEVENIEISDHSQLLIQPFKDYINESSEFVIEKKSKTDQMDSRYSVTIETRQNFTVSCSGVYFSSSLEPNNKVINFYLTAKDTILINDTSHIVTTYDNQYEFTGNEVLIRNSSITFDRKLVHFLSTDQIFQPKGFSLSSLRVRSVQDLDIVNSQILFPKLFLSSVGGDLNIRGTNIETYAGSCPAPENIIEVEN